MNDIIWFLTDIDFVAEWSKSSFMEKVSLLYTTSGLLFFEMLFFLSVIDIIF